MKNTKLLRHSSEIISESLRPHCGWEMTRYLQAQAIESAIADASKEVDFSIQSTMYAFDAELGVIANDLAERGNYPAAQRLAALLGVKRVLDNCPELPAIKTKLDPIFKELEAAKLREAEDVRRASALRLEKAARIEAAHAAATAEIEREFAQG